MVRFSDAQMQHAGSFWLQPQALAVRAGVQHPRNAMLDAAALVVLHAHPQTRKTAHIMRVRCVDVGCAQCLLIDEDIDGVAVMGAAHTFENHVQATRLCRRLLAGTRGGRGVLR